MKSPKPATDTIYPHKSHILRGSKGVGVTIESYGKVEISYINVANF
jgi:pantoate kinase